MNTATEFLNLFKHSKYTLCYLADKKMRSFPCLPGKLDQGIAFLEKHNKKGAEIYFMVNEGNGEYNAKRTACHGYKQLIGLSALFLDAELADNSDPSFAVEQFCIDNFVAPSITVKTSPNRYHYYWIINPIAVTKENVREWQQIQAFLHSKLSSDRTMTDAPQILRLPGFKNIKKNCEVTLYSTSPIYYNFSDLYNFLSNRFPELKDFTAFKPLQPVTEEYKVPPGERHEEILRRVRKLYSYGTLSDEEIKCFVDGFLENHVQDSRDFRAGGNRREEIERILSAAKGYAHEEKIKEASKIITQITEKKQKSNPFELDPDFFYQAPGPVGDLTRWMVDTATYPIPAHAFAASCSIFGLTKARYLKGPTNLPPLNYFLCLAPSASGKTIIEHKMKNILGTLQISHHLEDGITSAPGLISFVTNSNGLGLVFYGEAKDLFTTIQNKNAASYETKISTELVKLYTAHESYYTPPTRATDKVKRSTLKNPLFSFMGFGHFNLVENLFVKENVLEGLIPRFIILTIPDRRHTTPVDRALPANLIDLLRYHVTKSALIEEEKATTHGIDLAPPEKIKATHSTEANDLYLAFDDAMRSLYNSAVAERDGIEALFSRASEQVLRVSLAMSTDNQVTADTMAFATTLLSNQTQDFYQRFGKVINQTQYAKDTDRLYERILEECQPSPHIVNKRNLRKSTHRWYKGKGEFDHHIKELLEQGKISEHIETTAAGRKEVFLAVSGDT